LAFPLLATSGQDVEYIKVPELEKILNNPDDRLYVVNFWATWCGPCVKEFPVFEKVSKEYTGGKETGPQSVRPSRPRAWATVKELS
jgi:thiol-disulfide isomerase/thioredoxin